MNKILLIGNSGFENKGTDGQTIKVRLYLQKIIDEGFPVQYINLYKFHKHPFSNIRKIREGVNSNDRIILLTAQRGSKILIPLINFFNRNRKRVFVFPLIGTSVLHYSIDKLNNEQKNDFLINQNFEYCKPKKRLIKQLKQISYILPETEQLCEVFRNFYGLSNVFCVDNFREVHSHNLLDVRTQQNELKLVFLSRVMEEKGILDLVTVIKKIHSINENVSLDIYGKISLSEKQLEYFRNTMHDSSINYCGEVTNDSVVSTLGKYDLFVFPTKFVGEGTPGVIVESLLAGTPVLTSNFPQAKFLLKDGEDSIFFNMFDNEDLYNKLMKIIKNKNILIPMRLAAKESGNKYTYEHERANFLKYVCGVEEE